MKTLNELLVVANSAESNDAFLEAAIPLAAYMTLHKNKPLYLSCTDFIEMRYQCEPDLELYDAFYSRIAKLYSDMSLNEVSREFFGEIDTSSRNRVYNEWLERDPSLPKLCDYMVRVEAYIANHRSKD